MASSCFTRRPWRRLKLWHDGLFAFVRLNLMFALTISHCHSFDPDQGTKRWEAALSAGAALP